MCRSVSDKTDVCVGLSDKTDGVCRSVSDKTDVCVGLCQTRQTCV